MDEAPDRGGRRVRSARPTPDRRLRITRARTGCSTPGDAGAVDRRVRAAPARRIRASVDRVDINVQLGVPPASHAHPPARADARAASRRARGRTHRCALRRRDGCSRRAPRSRRSTPPCISASSDPTTSTTSSRRSRGGTGRLRRLARFTRGVRTRDPAPPHPSGARAAPTTARSSSPAWAGSTSSSTGG